MPKLTSIAIKNKSRAAMQALESVSVSTDAGIEGDYLGVPSDRQVTVLSLKAWREAVDLIGVDLLWTTRRANLLVDELELENTAGQTITIGDVELLITQETDPCSRMREVSEGLFDALNVHWRGGVCCRVVSGGNIRLGDDVVLHDAVPK